MSKNWTKGPWIAGRYGGSREDNYFVRSADGQKVAGRGGPQISKANADLIAAAPELYDACAALLALPLIVDAGLYDPNWNSSQAAKAISAARVALAKARGEQ